MSEDGGAGTERRPSFNISTDTMDGTNARESNTPQTRLTPINTNIVLPKTRSTSDLPSASATATASTNELRPPKTSPALQRLSFDASALIEAGSSRELRSPIISEHEHGMGASGLRRIRQQPAASRGSSSRPVSAGPSRSNSMTMIAPLTRNSSTNTLNLGPTSPTFNNFTEDLHRFPTESLHSFSFAQQSEDSIHNRQNVLKRSIDFMRDRLNWTATNWGIAQAQAKISGDHEMQSMMELLARAKLIGQDSLPGVGLGLSNALMTGPPEMTGENIFEKSFAIRSESPEAYMSSDSQFVPEQRANAADELAGNIQTALQEAPSEQQNEAVFENLKALGRNNPAFNVVQPPSPTRRRSALKRTLTDLQGLSIQGQLTDALAQPYRAQDAVTSSNNYSQELLSPRTAAPPVHTIPSTTPAAPHGHASRGAAAAQAVFTTEAKAPWTINSANDLACLVFGVTRAEVRRMGILEVVHESRRAWLEEKLIDSTAVPAPSAQPAISKAKQLHSETQKPKQGTPPPPSASPLLGGSSGITARLLSKPSSRVTGQGRRTKSADQSAPPVTDPTVGHGSSSSSSSGNHSAETSADSNSTPGTSSSSSTTSARPTSTLTAVGASSSRRTPSPSATPHHPPRRSRGVLLCGDVVPIQKRDGSQGSASLWVKEKRGGLIWVLEEIAEDVALLSVDEVGCVEKSSGAVTAIFGMERVRRGMDLARLIPQIPRLPNTNTGALDFESIAKLRRFTARTSNSISIPVSVDQMTDESTFRVSSFPHIAGIMVLNSNTLDVQSANSAFSGALFGYDKIEGRHIDSLIPNFSRLLNIMTDEEDVEMLDGIVVPELSFRRARAMLAIRDGSEVAAAAFLRPSGLPARHRTGADIMVDVQMRVVQSEPRKDVPPVHITDEVIVEASNEESADSATSDSSDPFKLSSSTTWASSEVVYALWITYSRQLHAANHGIGPVTPMVSRPGTPPTQPLPTTPGSGASSTGAGEETPPASTPAAGPILRKDSPEMAKLENVSSLASSLDGAPTDEDGEEPMEHPEYDPPPGMPRFKKTIAEFNILEDMGQGAYGQVKLCRYKARKAKKMVIKYVTKRRILVDTWHRDRRLGTVPLEIHVLDYLRRGALKHPNIVEMADFFEDETNYYIEMLPHGLPGMDLFDYIELRVNMDEDECRKIFVQVASAIHHLHVKAKVVHRDIKDENVVLDGEGNIKLIDFGSAAYIKNGPFDVFVGTIDYAAPEVLAGRPYRGKEQDVWALGILLYTIIYKENPFYSIDEIMDHDLRVPYAMSEASIDLVRQMLNRDVEQRISIQGVVDHPFCRNTPFIPSAPPAGSGDAASGPAIESSEADADRVSSQIPAAA